MSIGIQQIYSDFKKKNKGFPIDRDTYKKIVDKYLQHFTDLVISGKAVRIPGKMGSLTVVGKKVKPRIDKETGEIVGLSPDWAKTLKLWNEKPEARKKGEKIYFLNEHSDYIRYKFLWSKRNIYCEHKNYYSLQMCWAAKRTLASEIKKGKEYFVNHKQYNN